MGTGLKPFELGIKTLTTTERCTFGLSVVGG